MSNRRSKSKHELIEKTSGTADVASTEDSTAETSELNATEILKRELQLAINQANQSDQLMEHDSVFSRLKEIALRSIDTSKG